MTLRVDIIETASGGPVELTKQEAAKAWALLNASSIDLGFNTSSFTDNGVGDYTVGLTNAMNSTNSPPISAHYGTGSIIVVARLPTPSSCGLRVYNDAGSAIDTNSCFAIHGDLA